MEYTDLNIEDIIIKSFNGLAADAEQEILKQWIEASPGNKAYYERQRLEWESGGGGTSSSRFDGIAAYRRFALRVDGGSEHGRLRAAVAPLRGRSWLRRALYAAASVAALAIVSYISYVGGVGHTESRFADIVVEAPAGSHTKVVLPDGTVAWINSGSTIAYSQGFGVSDRTVKVSGESFFDVGKKSGLAFVVKTGGLTVKDVGTRFNLRDYPDEPFAEVSLAEGLVDVSLSSHPGREARLKPNQQLVIDKRTGRMDYHLCNGSEAGAWADGYLVMDGKTPFQIAKSIERRYGVKMVIESKKARSLDLHGRINIGRMTLAETLDVISNAGGISFRVSGNTVYVR